MSLEALDARVRELEAGLELLADDRDSLLWVMNEVTTDALIWVRLPDRRIVRTSLPATALFGYTPEEFLELHVEDLVPEAVRAAHITHVAAYADHPITRPMGIGLALQGRHKSGALFRVDVKLKAVPPRWGRLAVAVVRDLGRVG